jgi:hypothetical protein
VNWFSDRSDARDYVFQIARLWMIWLIGLGALFAMTGWYVLLAGVVVIAVLIWFVRPIQVRAAGIGDSAEVAEDTGGRFGGGRTGGDAALRALLYGEAPVAEAVNEYGMWSGWLWARRGVVALTALACVVVLLDVFQGPQ